MEVATLVKQWQGEAEKERQLRREAERHMASMQDEIKRLRAEAKKQDSQMAVI